MEDFVFSGNILVARFVEQTNFIVSEEPYWLFLSFWIWKGEEASVPQKRK